MFLWWSEDRWSRIGCRSILVLRGWRPNSRDTRRMSRGRGASRRRRSGWRCSRIASKFYKIWSIWARTRSSSWGWGGSMQRWWRSIDFWQISKGGRSISGTNSSATFLSPRAKRSCCRYNKGSIKLVGNRSAWNRLRHWSITINLCRGRRLLPSRRLIASKIYRISLWTIPRNKRSNSCFSMR